MLANCLKITLLHVSTLYVTSSKNMTVTATRNSGQWFIKMHWSSSIIMSGQIMMVVFQVDIVFPKTVIQKQFKNKGCKK